jgi:hypothetical protein
MFKHFKANNAPWSSKIPCCLPVSPTVQAIVIDHETVIDPQFASIIRYDAVSVTAVPEHPHAACPTHGEVI